MAASRNRPSTDPADLRAHVAAALGPAFAAGSRLCVGLSGGRDSVALLHLLTGIAPAAGAPLSALHVNHGLSPNAGRWQAFCADLCAAWGVPFRAVAVDVRRGGGEGIEAAARRARYGVFADCGADWVLLAHHRDDQAETVLLRLLRGAGVQGAAAMPAVRRLSAGPTRIGRPLLDVPRSAIDAWCETHGLAWIDDESNADTNLRRNYLRREIMPRLAGVFPSAADNLARAAGHFAEGADLLADLAEIDRARAASGDRIEVGRLVALPGPRARNLLRHEIAAAGGAMPDARRLDEVLRQFAGIGPDSRFEQAIGGVVLRAWRGEIHCDAPPGRPPAPVVWAGEAELPWGAGRIRFVPAVGEGIDARFLADEPVVLRPRAGGERLRPDPKRPRRDLRKLFQETGLPPWQRDALPFLWCGDRLAWVGGIGVDADFACAAGEAGWRPVWEREAGRDDGGR